MDQEDCCLLIPESMDEDKKAMNSSSDICYCNKAGDSVSLCDGDTNERSFVKSEYSEDKLLHKNGVQCSVCDNKKSSVVSSPQDVVRFSFGDGVNGNTSNSHQMLCREEMENQKKIPVSNTNNQNVPENSFTSNFSVNEFRDTIGFCQIRPMPDMEREGNVIQYDTDDITYHYPNGAFLNFLRNTNEENDNSDSQTLINEEVSGKTSPVSVSTEIMEILSDLDSTLDNSIVNNEILPHQLETANNTFKPKDDSHVDYIEIMKVNDDVLNNRDSSVNTRNDPEIIKEELDHVEDETKQAVTSLDEQEIDFPPTESVMNTNTEELRREEPVVVGEPQRRVRDRTRRSSMRLVSPLQLPNVPSPSVNSAPPQELSLSAQLFLETQDPERYIYLRPASANEAPRERGRRASTPRRCTSLHVHSRCSPSASVSTSSSSSAHSSPVHIPVSHNTIDEVDTNIQQDDQDEGLEENKEKWPVKGGPALAILSCTLSGYSVCRFSLLTLHFGANFVLQFLFLSVMFGIPLICLFVSFGRAFNSGPLGSWRVAPLFRGLGASLLLAQALIAAYYVAGLSWLLVYFSDSFVSQSGIYRWADPFSGSTQDDGSSSNGTEHLPLSIPAYLSEIVLRRSESPTLPFYSLFHICLLWVGVALILSKGLASYGKVVFILTLLPVMCLCVVAIRLLCVTPSIGLRGVLPYTNWGEFFINSKSWSAAAGECFMTWGLLAPTVWSLCGSPLYRHTSRKSFVRNLLPSLILGPITLLSGILITGVAETIIREHHYYYATTSYEHPAWWIFLLHERGPNPRHASHHSLLLGVCISRPGVDPNSASGLQPLRLATEIFPAAMALITTSQVSSFWSILFYGSLIMLGLSQLCVLTWGVTAGIIEICPRALRSRRGVLSAACCAGLLLTSLPLARGLELVHLLDYGTVGVWWQCLLQVVTIAAFFLVRGRPYAADALASTFLSPTSSLVPVLAFTWNVVLPIAMIVECVIDFKVGRYRQVVTGGLVSGYWTGGARVAIALLQLMPLMFVPLLAIVQCWRYLSKGPPDILDRIQLLYRPSLDDRGRVIGASRPVSIPATIPVATVTSAPPRMEPTAPPEDPPPKYTPPPSYSTATGARLAKLFTNSIRRSIRRVHRRFVSQSGESGSSGVDTPAVVFLQPTSSLSLARGYRSFRDKKSNRLDEVNVTRSSYTLPRLTSTPSCTSTNIGENQRISSIL